MVTFHDADAHTDTDVNILADFHEPRTRTRILADLSDTRRDFPREDFRDAHVYTCTVHDKL